MMAELEVESVAAVWTERRTASEKRDVQGTGTDPGGRVRSIPSTEGLRRRIYERIRQLYRGGSKRTCIRASETGRRLELDQVS